MKSVEVSNRPQALRYWALIYTSYKLSLKVADLLRAVGRRSPLWTGPIKTGLHIQSSRVRKKTPTLKPWIRPLEIECRNTEERLHHDILAFTRYIRPSPAEIVFRDALGETLIKHIMGAVSPKPQSVDIFGSCRIGMGLPGGDLDIVVTTTNSARHTRNAFEVADCLRESGIVREAIEVRHYAPVPIVNCCSVKNWGNVSVDISFAEPSSPGGQTSSVLVASMIESHLQAQPALAPLVFVLKAFLKQRDLSNARSGGLGSYPLTVMVISFLQLNPTGLPPKYITHPFDEGVHSLGRLLTDFLLYYGRIFPYREKYITIHPAIRKAQKTSLSSDGLESTSATAAAGPTSTGSVSSANVSSPGVLLSNVPDSDSPAAIATPVEVSMEDEETKETFSEGGLKPSAGVPWIKATPHLAKVSIQCPVDPEKDIGRGTGNMSTIAETFRYAAGVLLQARDPNVDVLCRIVGLHKEAILHRDHIEELVHSCMLRSKTKSSVQSTTPNIRKPKLKPMPKARAGSKQGKVFPISNPLEDLDERLATPTPKENPKKNVWRGSLINARPWTERDDLLFNLMRTVKEHRSM